MKNLKRIRKELGNMIAKNTAQIETVRRDKKIKNNQTLLSLIKVAWSLEQSLVQVETEMRYQAGR